MHWKVEKTNLALSVTTTPKICQARRKRKKKENSTVLPRFQNVFQVNIHPNKKHCYYKIWQMDDCRT